MTTSGTTSFSPDLLEIFEEAYERIGLEMRSGYDARTARRSFNIMMSEWANRGLNLWTVESTSVALVSGTAAYTLATDTVDVLDAAIRTGSGASQVDYVITRIAASTHLQIPTKNTTGRPLQYWVNRLRGAPVINLWPVPDSSSTYTLAYHRLRRVEDAGVYGNSADIPFRFIPALISGLAYYLAMKKKQEIAPALKAVYEEQFEMAAQEDRERSSTQISPLI